MSAVFSLLMALLHSPHVPYLLGVCYCLNYFALIVIENIVCSVVLYGMVLWHALRTVSESRTEPIRTVPT